VIFERQKIRTVVCFGETSVEASFNGWTLVLKRILDLVIAVPCVIILSPLLAAIAIAVRLDSTGGALFAQARLGKRGREFTLYKFRSMIVNAAAIGDGLASYEGDFRVTRVGRWLRNSGLDELPQLWNVIVGDMSLVGPRPAVVGELGELKELPREALFRFCVRPGVTGLAQVAGRNELAWPEKIQHDAEYVSRLGREGIAVDFKV
jgi:undecaprenyl phosphate N,N'-diacetylbacillosamine 1-phosphate transferase